MADIWRMLTENTYHNQSSVQVIFPGSDVSSEKLIIPVYPEQVNNSISTTYGGGSIVGRTGTFSAYENTSDITTNFSLHMHREAITTQYPKFDNGDNNLVDKIVSLIESACYPLYTSNGTYTPIVIYRFGDTLIKGKQTSANSTWSGPKIQGKYMDVTINISVNNAASKILSYNDIVSSNPRGEKRF